MRDDERDGLSFRFAHRLGSCSATFATMNPFVGDLEREHGGRDGRWQVIAKKNSSTEGRAMCGAQFRDNSMVA